MAIPHLSSIISYSLKPRLWFKMRNLFGWLLPACFYVYSHFIIVSPFLSLSRAKLFREVDEFWACSMVEVQNLLKINLLNIFVNFLKNWRFKILWPFISMCPTKSPKKMKCVSSPIIIFIFRFFIIFSGV